MAYTIYCYECKQNYNVVISSFGSIFDIGCSNNHFIKAVQIRCNNCNKEFLHFGPNVSTGSKSACVGCHLRVNIWGNISSEPLSRKSKPKKLSLFRVVTNLYLKKYPKYMWAPKENCSMCNQETVFYEFNKDGVNRHCSMCGELKCS